MPRYPDRTAPGDVVIHINILSFALRALMYTLLAGSLVRTALTPAGPTYPGAMETVIVCTLAAAVICLFLVVFEPHGGEFTDA